MIKKYIEFGDKELSYEDYKFVRNLPFYISAKIIMNKRQNKNKRENKRSKISDIFKYIKGSYRSERHFCRGVSHFLGFRECRSKEFLNLIKDDYEEIMPVALRISEYFATKLKQKLPYKGYKVSDMKEEIEKNFELYSKIDAEDTLFHLAVRFKDYDMMRFLIGNLELYKTARKIIGKKASVSLIYCDYISEMKKWRCKTELTSKGLAAKNSNGDTPLHLAVKLFDDDMVKLLLNELKTKYLSIENNKKETALGLANKGLELLKKEYGMSRIKIRNLDNIMIALDEEQTRIIKKVFIGWYDMSDNVDWLEYVIREREKKRGIRVKTQYKLKKIEDNIKSMIKIRAKLDNCIREKDEDNKSNKEDKVKEHAKDFCIYKCKEIWQEDINKNGVQYNI